MKADQVDRQEGLKGDGEMHRYMSRLAGAAGENKSV